MRKKFRLKSGNPPVSDMGAADSIQSKWNPDHAVGIELRQLHFCSDRKLCKWKKESTGLRGAFCEGWDF